MDSCAGARGPVAEVVANGGHGFLSFRGEGEPERDKEISGKRRDRKTERKPSLRRKVELIRLEGIQSMRECF